MKTIQVVSLCLFAIQLLATEQNPAFYAVRHKNTSVLENILKKDSNSTTLNQDDQTILHAAVIINNLRAVITIINSNLIDINHRDKHGKTAMDYAVEYGHNKIVRKLYKNEGKVTLPENTKEAKIIITKPFRILFFIGLALPLLGLPLAIMMYSFMLIVELIACIVLFPLIFVILLCGGNPVPAIGPQCNFFETMYIGGLTGAAIGGLFLIIGGSGWAYRAKQNLLLTEQYFIA